MMKNKRSFIFILVLCLCALLISCTQNTDAGKKDIYTAVTADSNKNILIPVDEITSSATFYNYDADGITVQLVAIRDSAGKAHISFNTCQSCSPSPKAYYRKQGDVLQCVNCGFTFEPEEVGLVGGGCNPWPIGGVSIGEETITIPVLSVEAMRSKFKSWKGPTE